MAGAFREAGTGWVWAFALAFSAAVLLRFAGISYGLPAVFNADEPHHVSIAVSFARGSLNPGFFKYPTLWMYVLFCAYGVYFLLWSALGGGRTVADFGVLFVWHPEGFYLLARVLSAGFSLAGLWLCGRAAKLLAGKRAGLWAVCLLAASPILVESAHAAKPDSLMFCLAAAAWLCALRHLKEGGERSLLLCGLFCGLAASTQYTAAPLALLPLAAALSRCRREGTAVRSSLRPVACAGAAFAAGFFGGSPFILLDAPSFLRDMRDQGALVSAGVPAGAMVLLNALRFAGPRLVGGTLLCLSAVQALRRRGPQELLLLSVPAVFLALLAFSPEGTWARYQLAVFPAYGAACAWTMEGLLGLLPRARALAPLAFAALLLPGAAASWAFDREALLPDTRTLAAAWIDGNVPAGACVLLDQEHASPLLRMERGQAQELLRRTRDEGHPRARYYELMTRSHPGGGYRILRILRSGAELHSGGWHARWSALGRDSLDVREGLRAARRAGVDLVVLSNAGAWPGRSPELSGFFEELAREGRLWRSFEPEPGVRRGPVLLLYRLEKKNPGRGHP